VTARLSCLAAGLVFAAGLALSGMTHPEKVLAFLDLFGSWDPSLALVIAGAAGVYFVTHRLARRLPRPLQAERFPDPPRAGIDRRLLLGSLVFGAGWGLSGFCPGPALVSVGAAAGPALWFVPAMIAGMALHRLLVPRSAGVAPI